MSMGRASDYIEIEVTLLIFADNPLVIVKQVADLTSIGTYQLQFKEPHIIHDFYFDTTEQALQNKKMTLRIREIGSIYLITLKMPAHVINLDYGTQRSEIEYLWSKDALTKIIRILNDQNIFIPSSFPDLNEVHPLDILTNLGLKLIQDRENFRKRRNIVITKQECDIVLAELVLDSIVYHFDGKDIGHHEIEIELKKIDHSIILKTIVEHLISIYGSKLRIWPHSKTVTGKAIDNLWKAGLLEGHLDSNNNLKPSAYEKIDASIRNMM
jgi:uncharacterized protein YjbK